MLKPGKTLFMKDDVAIDLTEVIRPRLRIALLLDSFRQPAWVHRAVSSVLESAIADVQVVVIATGATEPTAQPRASRRRSGGTSLLFDLYRRFDTYWFRDNRPDPFAETDLEPLLAGIPRLTAPAAHRESAKDSADVVTQLQSEGVDVALRLGAFAPLRGCSGYTRFGVWSYDGDDDAASSDGAIAPGYREVLAGEPITRSALQIDATASAPARTIYESFASTATLSAWKNRRELYWKTSAFVMRKLRELAEFGPAALEQSAAAPPRLERQTAQPSNIEMLGYLPRLAATYVATQVATRASFDQWHIAYRFHTEGGDGDVPDTRVDRFTPLIPPKDRMWADPFPIVRDGRHFVFVEELLFARNKGHISVMEFDAKGTPSRPELVLETENHLSYPFLLQWKGETFMVPESARAGDSPTDIGRRSVPVFRARGFPQDWVQETVMLEGLEVFDPTIVEIEGTWWLFCTQAEPGGSTWDELHLYHGSTPLGPWTAHRRNPVKSDVRSARPAGRPYRQGDAWYRPAQNCSLRYGYGITINRIERLTRSEYRETEVMSIFPDWAPGLIGTHTINAAGGLTVADARMRRRKSSGEAPLLAPRSSVR